MNMSKIVIFLMCFLLLSIIAIPEMYKAHKEPEVFSAQGIVSSINWKSRNHGMPIIEIRDKNGTTTKFSSNRITLIPEQLKVGDSFNKQSDSSSCEINDKLVRCVN